MWFFGGKKKNTLLAWHFTQGWQLRDGRELIIGKTYKHKGKVSMCFRGLHASINILDALAYAPGMVISRVLCSKIEQVDNNKLVCRERKILYAFDAQGLLQKFARKCALDVLYLWKPPEIVVTFLSTGQQNIAAKARAAACASHGYGSNRCNAAHAAFLAAHDTAVYDAGVAYDAAGSAAYAADIYDETAARRSIREYQNSYLEWLLQR